MIRVKNTEFITDSQEHFTMQEFSSTVSLTPSFSFFAPGDLVEAAVRVIHESESYYSVKFDGNDDAEFEFETLPLSEESLFHFPTTTTTTFFKRSSDDGDVATARVMSKDLFFDGWNINIDPSPPSPSQSHSSSESEDSENISPRRCFWSPIRSPARGDSSKSKSPRRCLLKNPLRRSHSDGAVSTSSAPKRCSFKDILRRSHSDGGDGSSISPSGNGSPAVKGNIKTASYKPEVDRRRKSYLPYRQDLIDVFAGMSRFRH